MRCGPVPSQRGRTMFVGDRSGSRTGEPLVTVQLRMLALSVVLGALSALAAGRPAPGTRVRSRWETWPVAGEGATRGDLSVVRRNRPRGARLGDTRRARRVGRGLYFWARVAYVPLYASGSPIVRSPVWNVATIDTMLIIALFLGWIRTLPGAMVRTPPCLRASPRSISESNTRLTPNKLVHIVHTN